jgi:membrane protease YdiL (CAAX protease family)
MNSPRRDIAALVFVHLFPLLMAWLYLVALRTPADTPSPPIVAITFALAKIIQFAFPALYVWRREPARLRLAPPTVRGLLFGLGFGLGVALLIFALYFGWLAKSPLFAQTPPKVYRLVQELRCDSPARFWLLAAGYSIAHSLLEEYYWRWFAFGWLRRYASLSVAIGLSALGFTAHHVVLLTVFFPDNFWTLVLPLSLGIMLGGAAWAWIYELSRSLYAIWLSHGLVDAAIFVIGFTMVAPYWGQ